MRRLRIVQPVQLELAYPAAGPRPASVWAALPETSREGVLAVFARLIAHAVLADDDEQAS